MKLPEQSRRRLAALTVSVLFFGLAGDGLSLSLSPVARAATAATQRPKRRQTLRRMPPPVITAAASGPAPTASQTPSPDAAVSESDSAGIKVKLYYLREATKVVTLLKAIAATDAGANLKELVIANATEDEIVLYGSKEKRNYARRIIATLDLPRPGIEMEMWGVQISSPRPEEMAKVMIAVRQVINQTQQDVREVYDEMQRAAREVISDDETDPEKRIDPAFKQVLQHDLAYRSALDADRPLSLTDILMRMIAAEDPSGAAVRMAARLNRIGERLNAWRADPRNKQFVKLVPERRPFERFLKARGLRHNGTDWVDDGSVRANALIGRKALLEFALHYGRLVHEPQDFDAYQLQQAAEVLNSRLQAAIDALNLDMQDLFVTPTLIKIQKIVRDFKDVDYAQVGKTSVSSLSGTQTQVTSGSVSAFDVTPPLRLSELLAKADTLSQSVGKFVPNPAENVVGAMPLSQFVGLIAAFGEERSVWRELKAGVSLTITPNVLRNMTSAELAIILGTGDPQGGTREQGVRPLSRVSQHDVKTSVYVNALDFFDLSAFNSQSTIDGGRGYVPIVGTIWRGIFSDVPVVGNLLSWKKEAKTVYHESLVLTTAFITPTAMGVAVLYPTELLNPETNAIEKYNFADQWRKVQNYKSLHLFRRDARASVGGGG